MCNWSTLCLFFHNLHVESFSIICSWPNASTMAMPDVVARRHLKQLQSLCTLFSVLMFATTSTGVVLQPGMARHYVLPQCGQQRHPEGKSTSRKGSPPVRHLRFQSPPQPHKGAALPCCNVSRKTKKEG